MIGTALLDERFKPWAEYLVAVAQFNFGSRALITSGFRTYQQQARLYRRFLQGMSQYPALPPGTSMHELGLAVDIGGLTPDEYGALGAWWRSLGGNWGESDRIHFEA